MTSIVPKPILLSDIDLIIDEDNYEASVNEVTLTPTATVNTFTGMTPEAVFPVVGTPAWGVRVGFAQDHETEGSLSEYCRLNAGKRKTMKFAPVKGGAAYEIDVLIVPAVIGGQGNALATSTVDMQGFGQPERVPAPTPDPGE